MAERVLKQTPRVPEKQRIGEAQLHLQTRPDDRPKQLQQTSPMTWENNICPEENLDADCSAQLSHTCTSLGAWADLSISLQEQQGHTISEVVAGKLETCRHCSRRYIHHWHPYMAMAGWACTRNFISVAVTWIGGVWQPRSAAWLRRAAIWLHGAACCWFGRSTGALLLLVSRPAVTSMAACLQYPESIWRSFAAAM